MHNLAATIARGRNPSRAAAVAAWALMVLLGDAVAVGAPPVAPRPVGSVAGTRAIVDPAVVPAGGVPCQQCGRLGCRLHHGHLAECRDGLCAPHCPVRPGEYGFYRTQWRRWPGQGVVPASAEEAATPARPPASQVPTIDEESPRLPDEAPMPPDGSLPADPIPEDPAAADAVARPEETKPAKPPAPRAVEPAPVPPTPPGEPPVRPEPEPLDAGLFDQSATPPAAVEPIDVGAMRYPAQVGRSVAAGAVPWRLEPAARQRVGASDRGL